MLAAPEFPRTYIIMTIGRPLHKLHAARSASGQFLSHMLPHRRSFDATGDGYGRGEGFIAAVLAACSAPPPASLALLLGSATNQDGRSSGLTAPNGPSQRALIQLVLQHGGISPGAVGAVAVHGTGTPLGDPIEVGAIVQTYGSAASSGSCAGPTLVSNKSCFGHTEGAAGGPASLACMHACCQWHSLVVCRARSATALLQ